MDALKQQNLSNLLAGAVAAVGFELWGYEFFPRGNTSLLRVYIENKNGITIDNCAAVSQQISAVLEVENPIASSYTLEVSSPGLNRPLYTIQHYQNFVGSQIKIRLYQPRSGRRNFSGRLCKAENTEITMEVEEESLQFSLNDIEKANLIVEI